MIHDWIPSTLGHGNTMCRRCRVMDLEAAAFGLDECPGPADAQPRPDLVQGSDTYTCNECGREMVTFGAQSPVPGTCLTCQHMPGWWRVPELRKAFRMEAGEGKALDS